MAHCNVQTEKQKMTEYKQQCDYVEGTLDVLRISGRRQVAEVPIAARSARDGSARAAGLSETLETRMKNIWESFILTLQHAAEFITTNLPQVLHFHFLLLKDVKYAIKCENASFQHSSVYLCI